MCLQLVSFRYEHTTSLFSSLLSTFANAANMHTNFYPSAMICLGSSCWKQVDMVVLAVCGLVHIYVSQMNIESCTTVKAASSVSAYVTVCRQRFVL